MCHCTLNSTNMPLQGLELDIDNFDVQTVKLAGKYITFGKQ